MLPRFPDRLGLTGCSPPAGAGSAPCARPSMRMYAAHWLPDRGFQSPLRCFQACHLGTFSRPGRYDTCRLVAVQLVRAVSRTVTVAVFADGLRAAGPGIPRSAPRTRAGHRQVRVGGSRPWARDVAPDVAGGACALRRSGARAAPWRTAAQPPGALRRPPQTGVPRWAALITLRLPRRPPSRSPAHGVHACRPGCRPGARPRRL
jgi:hypothetical protein